MKVCQNRNCESAFPDEMLVCPHCEPKKKVFQLLNDKKIEDVPEQEWVLVPPVQDIIFAYKSPHSIFEIGLFVRTSSFAVKEVKYGGYKRKSVHFLKRKEFQMENINSVFFPQCVSGSTVVTHVGVFLRGVSYPPALSDVLPEINISNGITPAFGVGNLTMEFYP